MERETDNGLSGSQDSLPPHRGGVVTLLFTDVVGSTALKDQLGNRAGFNVLHEHDRMVRQVTLNPDSRE